MPVEVTVAKAEGRNDLDFTSVLRESLVSAVIAVDDRRRVAGFNTKAESLLHLKAANVIGESFELLPPPLREYFEDAFAAAKPLRARQLALPARPQGELAIQATVTPVRPDGGKTSGMVMVLHDVSSAKKWEANMRRLDRLHSVGTLSASMAHEVKNAFVAIKTFVDLLLEKNQQADLADVVRLELGRIDAMLGQMRKFSGPAHPNLSEVRVHCVLDKSLLLIQHLLEEKKIKVVRALDAPNDLLRGDPDQLEQAFLNLFFNALDAMKPHGKLSVVTGMVAADAFAGGGKNGNGRPWLRVSIGDNGAGIPPDHMERLFEPFFTTKPDGTGLGLAITHRIVQEHEGAVTVESELHKGTTFNLLLPTAAA